MAGYFKHSVATWGFINGGNFWRTDLVFLTVLTHRTSSIVLELECFASAELRDVVFLWEQREWPIGLCDQCPCLREKETKRLAKKGGARVGGNPHAIHWVGVSCIGRDGISEAYVP